MTNDTEINDTGSPLPKRLRDSAVARTAGTLYRTVTDIRNNLYDLGILKTRKTGRPVISIGGLRAGGSGKTPAVMMIGRYIVGKGGNVAFLSRGYRRKGKNDIILSPGEECDWEIIGDEPALLRKEIPLAWCGVGADRVRTARELCKKVPGNTIFIMDDGFQHRRLRRDLDIVCLHDNFLHDRLIPAGFLRETTDSLSRAHIALVIGDSVEKVENTVSEAEKRFPKLDIFPMVQKPAGWVDGISGCVSKPPAGLRPLLVCGIARPERFSRMVRSMGIEPVKDLYFPDHHTYSVSDFAGKGRELYSNWVVTTGKDYIRLQSQKVVISANIWYLNVELAFSRPEMREKFFSIIDNHLSQLYS